MANTEATSTDTTAAAVTPETIVSFMRGYTQIDSEADATPEQAQVLALMSEMRVQADALGYDVSGKIGADIEGERCQLTWSFNRLQKGAK